MDSSWCDHGKNHAGPCFTVSILALQWGPGSRLKNKTHILGRKTLARLCGGCLREARLRFECKEFFALNPVKD